jgi:cytochrome c biogenesis protein
MKSLWNYFSSVKLAIFLLIIITIASIIGTLIPQNRGLAEYLARYGQWGNLFHRLQLTKLYQSSWFIALLSLFALNIIVCTLTRLTPKLRKAFKPKLEIEPKQIAVLKIKEKFKKNTGLDTTKKELEKELRSRHYRLQEVEGENKTSILARKRILGWFGADVVHLGILVILAGGIISGAGRVRKDLTFAEGEVFDIQEAGFKLRLDKFETEYYPNGSVKDWKSTLTVIESEKPVLSKVVEVNHPLTYKGFVFYQSSYGWNWTNTSVGIWVRKRKDPSFLRKIEMKVGQRLRLEGENIQISVRHFIPDFIINDRNEITSRSLQPNNPAAFIEGWDGDEKIMSGWIFSKFPDFARIHSKKETDLSFELKDFKADQLSVIEAAKDPGVNLIWVGCTLLMIGLAFAFYWPPREIKVILEESQGKTEITAGGIASKSKEALESEFEKIMTSLRRSR